MSSLLGALEPDRLARGIELRPDLLVPRSPLSIQDLAGRVTRQPSVALAVAGCDRWCRQLIDVALVLRGPTSTSAIAGLVRTAGGDRATDEQVDAGVERLADRLLLFLDGDRRIWLNPGLVPLVHRPCGLGAPAGDLLSDLSMSTLRRIADAIGAEAGGRSKPDLVAAIVEVLTDLDAVGRLLEAAPAEALKVLRQARSGYADLPYTSWSRPAVAGDAVGPHAWLLARGLLVDRRQGYGYGHAEVPREVGLALRGGVALVAGAPEPPPLAAVAAGDPADLDRRAAGRAGTTIRSVTRLLGLLEAAPASTLKNGGVGTREVGRLAKALDVSTDEAFLLLEVAAAAGLVPNSSYAPVVPTTAADTWLDASPGDRWLDLARAWLDAPGIPSIAGHKDPTGKVVPGLVSVRGVDGRRLRRTTLDLLASAGPGEGASGDLVGAVRWALPAVVDGLDTVATDLVGWTVAEATVLGLASDGALTSLGRLLHAGDEAAAAEHASSLLVDAPAEIILQADLTAVVDAAAPQGLLDELRLLADAESAGSALVLRFSRDSVRRGLDAGRDADEILAFLSAHAVRGVPQPLEYLVTDTARRWGSVRIGAVATYVRSDDPVLLEEATRHRRLAKLGLRLLAPTVAVSEAEPAPVLTALRDAGFLPVEEDAGGVTLRAPARRERAAGPVRAPGRGEARTVDPVDARALAEALLAAPAEPDTGLSAFPAPRSSHPGPNVRPGDLDLHQLRDVVDALGTTDPDALADLLGSLRPAELADWFGPNAAREMAALFEDPSTGYAGSDADLDGRDHIVFDDDLDTELDPVEVFDTLVGLLDSVATVELRIADPDTGRERSVTGPVVEVDVPAGRVTIQREPDGAMVTVDPDDVFEIRVLRSSRGRS